MSICVEGGLTVACLLRPEKCLQHYMLMKEFYIGEEENMVTLTRGCILKMYHTQNFKISSLKALLWNELPDKTNPAHYTVTVSLAFRGVPNVHA